MTLGQVHDTPFFHGQQLCVKYYPDPTWQWWFMARTRISSMCYCNLDLGNMTLDHDHDTPCGHGQQLCDIMSRSDKGVRSYGPDTMWTDGQTDREADGQTERQTDNYVCRGYNNKIKPPQDPLSYPSNIHNRPHLWQISVELPDSHSQIWILVWGIWAILTYLWYRFPYLRT